MLSNLTEITRRFARNQDPNPQDYLALTPLDLTQTGAGAAGDQSSEPFLA